MAASRYPYFSRVGWPPFVACAALALVVVHFFGWGWSLPGLRMVAGPVELGAEYRHYEKQFIGEFFNGFLGQSPYFVHRHERHSV